MFVVAVAVVVAVLTGAYRNTNTTNLSADATGGGTNRWIQRRGDPVVRGGEEEWRSRATQSASVSLARAWHLEGRRRRSQQR